MDVEELKQQANTLFEQKWLPGRDQKEIRQAVSDLEHILSELQTRNSPAAQTVLLRTQILYEQTEQLLYQEIHPVNKPGLQDLLTRLQPLLSTTDQHPRSHARYLLNHSTLQAQKNLSALRTDIKSFKHIPFSYVQSAPEDADQLVESMHAHNLPVTLEKRYHTQPRAATNTQTNLELIGAPAAWEHASGEGIHVGVADTGCDYQHQALRTRFGDNKGYDFISDTNQPLDDNGHGTHVAGIIAGTNVGVAPNAKLYALKFLNAHGSGSQTDFIRAAEWAIDHELDVLNGSFGSAQTNEAEEAICDALQERGVLFVAAAGNRGNTEYSYPASYESVISTAAVNNDKTRAPFSQYNDQVTISAPGVDIRSCVPGGYDVFSGTSMAAPHVAGAAALIQQRTNNSAQTKDLLLEAAEELGAANKYGRGLVRPDKALNLTDVLARYYT